MAKVKENNKVGRRYILDLWVADIKYCFYKDFKSCLS